MTIEPQRPQCFHKRNIQQKCTQVQLLNFRVLMWLHFVKTKFYYRLRKISQQEDDIWIIKENLMTYSKWHNKYFSTSWCTYWNTCCTGITVETKNRNMKWSKYINYHVTNENVTAGWNDKLYMLNSSKTAHWLLRCCKVIWLWQYNLWINNWMWYGRKWSWLNYLLCGTE
jgi:hypothetical protein